MRFKTYFLVVLCKTTTWNHQTAAAFTLRYAEVEVWRRKRQSTHAAIFDVITEKRNLILIDVSLGVAVLTAWDPLRLVP